MSLFRRFVSLLLLVLATAGWGQGGLAQPAFTAQFSPTAVEVNGISTLIFTIDNSAGEETSSLAFSATLPAAPGNMTIAAADASHTCGAGTLTAPDGAGSVNLGGASVARGAVCTVTIRVTVDAAGSYTLPVITLTSSAGSSTSDPVDLTASAPTQLDVTKALSVSTVDVGEDSTVSYTFTNTSGTTSIGSFSFNEILPVGVVLATPSNVATTCTRNGAATISAPAGGNQLSFSKNGFNFSGFESLLPNESCNLTFAVRAMASGSYLLTSNAISSDSGSQPAKSVLLTVRAVPQGIPDISKAFATPTVGPGETVGLTFTIRNTDRTQSMTQVSFSDDLDAMLSGALATGLPLADLCGNGSSVSGSGTITLTGGSLSPGSQCSFTVPIQIPSGVPAGQVTNVTRAVTASLGGAAPAGTDTAQASISVQTARALTLSRAFVPNTAAAGGTVALRHTITNPNGSLPATDIVLAEDLSGILDGATYSFPATPCGPGSSLGPNIVTGSDVGFTLTNGSLAASDSCSFDVEVNIPSANTGGTFTDTSSAVMATINSGTVTSATTTSTISINGGASLSLSKVFEDTQDGVNDGSVSNGGLLDMVLTLSSGPESAVTATSIDFTDDLNAFSAGTTGSIIGDTCGGAAMSAGDTLLTVAAVSLDPGADCTITLRLTIAGAGNAPATNTTSDVSFSAAGTAGSAPAASDTIFLGDDGKAIALSHAYSPNPVVAGDVLAVTYTLTNPNASADATGIQFSHSVSSVISGLTITDTSFAACNGGSFTPVGGNLIVLTSGSLSAGASCNFTVNLAVSSGATTGDYSSTTSQPTATVGGSSVSGVASSAALSVNNEPLLFTKAFQTDPISPGGTSELVFTLENPLGIPLTDIAFTDDMGTILPGSSFGAALANGCGGMNAGGGGLLDYQGGTLAANASCTIRIPVTVPAAASNGIVTNTTSALTATAGGLAVGADPAIDTLTISATADAVFSVAFTKSGEVQQGGTITAEYRIQAPTGVALDNLSFSHDYGTDVPGMEATNLPISTPCGTGSTASGSGMLLFSGGTIPAGGSCTFSVQLSVPVTAPAGAVLSTTTALTRNGLQIADAATDNIHIIAVADLAVTVDDSLTSVRSGETLTYTIVAANAGPSNSTSAILADTFPSSLTCSYTAVGAGGASGFSASGTGDINDSPVLPAGASVTYTASCLVDPKATGTLSNTVTISGSDPDPTPGNDTATDDDTVITAAEVGFAKAFSPATVAEGAISVLTFTIDNGANGVAANGMAFSDDLPSGMELAANPAASNGCGGTLTAPAGAGSLNLSGGTVGDRASCTVSVTVRATDSGSLVNTTSALTSNFPDTAPASATLTVTPAPPPAFSKSFADANIVQGGVTTLTFEIDNASALVDAIDITFGDTFPPGMTIAAVPNKSSTCGRMLDAPAGAASLSFAGGILAAGATCQIMVDVTAVALGTAINVSGDMTSSLGNSGTASDSLEVTAAPVLGFAKAFGDASIVQGATTTLTFTIDNADALIAADRIAFGDTFPAGMTVAPTPNVADTCGGTLTASAGAASISYGGGALGVGASCTVSLDVAAVQVGTANNVSDALTSSLGNSGTANAALVVTAADAPAFSKAFAPDTITQGDISTLTLVIDNTSSLIEATGLAFVDSFPAGLNVAAVPNAATSCTGGSVSTDASSVTLTGGTVAAGESCDVTVDVTSATAGSVTNTSGTLTSSLGDSGTATASLTVTAATAPGLTYAFSPPEIPQGGTSNLIITVDNTANLIDIGPINVNGTLPAGLLVAGPSSTTCGGTLNAPIGSGSISVANGTVAASSTCTVTIPVTSSTVGAAGDVTVSLTSPAGGATGTGTGSPLVVIVAPQGTVTIVQNADVDATFGFSSDAAALNFSISTVGGTGRAGPISLTVGTYVIRQSRPVGAGNQSLSCTDADSTADTENGVVTIRLDAFENVTCTFSSANSGNVAADAISNFMQRRNNLILSHGPSRSRRLDRLRGFGSSQTLSFQQGDVASFAPVSFNLLSLGSGSYDISTSLRQVEEAALKFRLGNDLEPDSTAVLQNRRFDVWFEAHYSKFNASQGSGGDFGIAYLGADYLFSSDLLAGVMLQFDTLEDINTTDGTLVEGNGWMIGPYLTTRLAPNLILDARLAYGQSRNDFSTPLSTGSFPTDRWLVDVNFSGDFDHGNWVISPIVNISYIEDRKPQTRDTLNAIVPGFTESLGQIKFGPTISSSHAKNNNLQVQQTYSIKGIYNFSDNSRNAFTSAAADETDGLRARVEAGWRIINRHGTSFDLGLNYDGIGASDFEAYGLKFGLHVPLQ